MNDNNSSYDGSNKKRKKKMSAGKKTAIVIGVFAGLILIILLIAFLYLHGLIGKIDYKPTGDVSIADSIEPDDDLVSGIDDSPKSEIEALEEQIRKNMEENSTDIIYDEDVYNVLLIGSDTRVTGENGRSDSMILVSINKKTNKIIATSLMRDMYVAIPGKGQSRINAAHAYGGPELLMLTVEKNFKIKVDRYVSVDFYSFIDLIDELGGVTIEVTEDEVEYINLYVRNHNIQVGDPADDSQLSGSGKKNLNGKQALAYSRIRKIGNDFGRTERQRKVLEQIFEKIKDKNIIQLNELLNTFLPALTTNIPKGEIFSLILSVPSFSKYEFEQLRIPADGTYRDLVINKAMVLGVDFQKNIDLMREVIYNDNSED